MSLSKDVSNNFTKTMFNLRHMNMIIIVSDQKTVIPTQPVKFM